MPITPTEAKLWFDTKEEQDLYDEKMIANIELKSLDFDDENFSPVFDRAKQEFFLEPGEKMKSDFDRLNKPLALHSVEELIDRYWLYKPNHTYFRTWTFDKFLAGFGFGYVLLRELPLRNFYARCLVMSLFASKLLDHFDNIWPSFVPQGTLTLRPDPWINDDIKCFNNATRVLNVTDIPTARNQISEQKKWYAKQPAHVKRAEPYGLTDLIGAPFRKTKQAFWDGTMNMPILRLGDPKHKDCYNLRF